MKRWIVLFTLASFLAAACGGTPESGTGSGTPANLGTFREGEPVTFEINETVHVCSEWLPYDIVQVTEGEERTLMLRHSCLGIAGSGIDQYCENGQVKTETVITCSDAILCEDQKLNEKVVWDQQEYVEISKDCAGQTIHREVKQQVPTGQYKVVVLDWKEDHVEPRIFAEFTITSD